MPQNETVSLWGMLHWAEGTSRQWLRSVIRSCFPHPCWLKSSGHRPFSLGKPYVNHLNWHKLSRMLLNVFYSLLWLRELERETSLSLKVFSRVCIHICESTSHPRVKSSRIFDSCRQFLFCGSVLEHSSRLCSLSFGKKLAAVACLPSSSLFSSFPCLSGREIQWLSGCQWSQLNSHSIVDIV